MKKRDRNFQPKRGHGFGGRITCVEENGELAMYIEVDGKRVAKRGLPGTPQARTWISLEPGWVVRDHDYPHGIEIEYDNVSAH